MGNRKQFLNQESTTPEGLLRSTSADPPHCSHKWPHARITGAFAADTHMSDPPPAMELSRYHLICLIGYSLSFVIFGSQVSILGPTIKPLAERLGVEETDLSPLFTALGVSCIISGTPSGWVVDRFPTHRVLIVSLLVEVGGNMAPR